MSNGIKTYFDKHKTYFSYVWYLSALLGFIYSYWVMIVNLFSMAQSNNILGFAFIIIFNGVIATLLGMWYAFCYFIFFSVILFLPYLLVRGLVK